MGRIVHIDITRDISAYGTTGTSDSISFVYDSTNNKGNWICGEINLTNKFIVTAALLDDRVTSQDGLEFFAWFNVQDGIDDHLHGRPYAWSHDRLEIHEDYMQFLRIAGLVGTQISRLGVNVKKKDGESNYDAPASQGSRVQFDNLAILVPISTLDDLSEQTRDEIERADGKLQDVEDDVVLIRKYMKNKRKVDTTANTETIYDDDGSKRPECNDADVNLVTCGLLQDIGIREKPALLDGLTVAVTFRVLPN